MLILGNEIEKGGVLVVAQLMCIAARTAPKVGGFDNIVTSVITGEDKDKIVETMKIIGKETDMYPYLINAEDVDDSELIVLIGMKSVRYGLKGCNFCGFSGCKKNKEAGAVCAMAIVTLGIAVGSALSVAGRNHVDNRVMFTIGKAALRLNLLDNEVKIAFGIPLSVKGKNIYFDKEWKKIFRLEKWEPE